MDFNNGIWRLCKILEFNDFDDASLSPPGLLACSEVSFNPRNKHYLPVVNICMCQRQWLLQMKIRSMIRAEREKRRYARDWHWFCDLPEEQVPWQPCLGNCTGSHGKDIWTCFLHHSMAQHNQDVCRLRWCQRLLDFYHSPQQGRLGLPAIWLQFPKHYILPLEIL